jgi:hypothetical protein
VSRAFFGVSLLGVSLILSGCHSMMPVRGEVQPERAFEVRFSPERAIDVRNPDGSRTSLGAVGRIQGQAISVRGDSVTFRIDSWRGGNPVEEHTETRLETVLPTSDPGVSFFRNRISVKKNLLAVAIVVGLVSLAIGQASVGGY